MSLIEQDITSTPAIARETLARVASDDPEQHDASMVLMRHRFDIAPGDEIKRIWQQPRQGAAK